MQTLHLLSLYPMMTWQAVLQCRSGHWLSRWPTAMHSWSCLDVVILYWHPVKICEMMTSNSSKSGAMCHVDNIFLIFRLLYAEAAGEPNEAEEMKHGYQRRRPHQASSSSPSSGIIIRQRSHQNQPHHHHHHHHHHPTTKIIIIRQPHAMSDYRSRLFFVTASFDRISCTTYAVVHLRPARPRCAQRLRRRRCLIIP